MSNLFSPTKYCLIKIKATRNKVMCKISSDKNIKITTDRCSTPPTSVPLKKMLQTSLQFDLLLYSNINIVLYTTIFTRDI